MQWLLVRYLPPDKPHLVPAAFLGGLMLLGRLTEGIGFALFAHWSDNCRAQSGRRLPFMRASIVPFAAMFFLLFMPPVDHAHWLNMLYAAVTIPVYFGLYGAVVVPYLALLPELSRDNKERINLSTWQSLFILLSTILFGLSGPALNNFGWPFVMATAAVLGVAFFMPACLMLRETKDAGEIPRERLPLWPSVVEVLRNQPFRRALISIGLFWFALNALTALVPYWAVINLGRSEDDVAKLMGLYLLVSFAASLAINRLAKRFGKYATLLGVYLAGAAIFPSLALVGHLPFGDEFTQSLVVLALCGIPVAGFLILPFAILADVVDYDTRLTGRRREATFFGVRGVLQKLLIGVSVLTFTIVPYVGSDGSRVLRPDGWISFSASYSPLPDSPVPADSTPRSALAKQNPAGRSVCLTARPAGLPAPWLLSGPDGLTLNGKGDAVLPNMAPGAYSVAWGDLPGWTAPASQRTPTPAGLKFMALLCGIFSAAAFIVFRKYPLREQGMLVPTGRARWRTQDESPAELAPIGSKVGT
jgi:GPH family glycoside/pentoside/hexuronide:cation symporter